MVSKTEKGNSNIKTKPRLRANAQVRSLTIE